MIKSLKAYFHYDPAHPGWGDSGFWAFFWILDVTGGKNFIIFFLPLMYLAYTGNKLLILLAASGILTFTYYAWISADNYSFDCLIMLILYVTFIRDMYFLWRYDLNAFAHQGDEETGAHYYSFTVGLISLFILCAVIYKLRQSI